MVNGSLGQAPLGLLHSDGLQEMIIMNIMARLMICGSFMLSACNEYVIESTESERYDTLAAPEPMMLESAGEDSAGSSSESPAATNYLAYRYGYDFSLPVAAVKPTADHHAKICHDAGPRFCQILSQSTREFDADNVTASITLRAAPEWLVQFSETISQSVVEADGKLTSSRVSAEDLTRQILDVDARLSAQKTLRDRLQSLLETRDAELSDLLALERELARVQGDIESATSTLRALRERVMMSIVDINYETRRRAVAGSVFSPVGAALDDFFGAISVGLAAIIMLVAFVLPWLLLVILPGFWVFMWFRRRWSPKMKHQNSKTS
jgi:hypothetical protein